MKNATLITKSYNIHFMFGMYCWNECIGKKDIERKKKDERKINETNNVITATL